MQRVVYAPGPLDIPRYHDLYGCSRDLARPNIIPSRRYERARGRGITCSRVRTRARRYDNIFSRNSGYLRCTCFAVCGPPRAFFVREKRKEERQFAREDDICPSLQIRWHDREPCKSSISRVYHFHLTFPLIRLPARDLTSRKLSQFTAIIRKFFVLFEDPINEAIFASTLLRKKPRKSLRFREIVTDSNWMSTLCEIWRTFAARTRRASERAVE